MMKILAIRMANHPFYPALSPYIQHTIITSIAFCQPLLMHRLHSTFIKVKKEDPQQDLNMDQRYSLAVFTDTPTDWLFAKTMHATSTYGNSPSNNKVLVRTSSLRFFKIYRQPIIKFWLVPVWYRYTRDSSYF